MVILVYFFIKYFFLRVNVYWEYKELLFEVWFLVMIDNVVYYLYSKLIKCKSESDFDSFVVFLLIVCLCNEEFIYDGYYCKKD